jgi:tetratricopeptide (TPR) repeat protein
MLRDREGAVHRKSILRLVACDLKKLPIGALERFVLSQVHGHAVAEEVADVTGLELSELFRVARHLVDLGALSVDGERAKTKRPTMAPQKKARATSLPPPRKGGESLVPPTVVPAPRKNAEMRSLGIGPREGFVLSQIDGVTSVADLGEITGLSPTDLGAALRALEAAGAVSLGAAKRRPSMSGTQPTTPKAARPAPASMAPARAAPPAPSAPESEACDVSVADRARITETAARVEALDLYGVLGVEREAEAKTIRRAYHSLAGQFHPDRYFGKKLGPLRKPLDRVFMRLTLAYETLSKRDRRVEYDATLPPRPSKPAPTQKPPQPPRRLSTQKVPAVRTPSRRSVRAVAAAVSAVQSRPVVPPVPAPAPRPRVPPAAPPPPPAPAAPRDRRVPQERALVFVRAAEEALDRHDFVAAANNYRLAVQCSDDPALRVALEETDAKARVRVRETSLAAARTAEQSGRWAEAGEKYAKAHAAQPEPWVAERAANAIRLAAGDLRAAARLAEQAVLAEPTNAAYRVTLGEVYFDAGLLARAAGESARAIALAPNDVRASALAKLVAKGKRA